MTSLEAQLSLGSGLQCDRGTLSKLCLWMNEVGCLFFFNVFRGDLLCFSLHLSIPPPPFSFLSLSSYHLPLYPSFLSSPLFSFPAIYPDSLPWWDPVTLAHHSPRCQGPGPGPGSGLLQNLIFPDIAEHLRYLFPLGSLDLVSPIHAHHQRQAFTRRQGPQKGGDTVTNPGEDFSLSLSLFYKDHK